MAYKVLGQVAAVTETEHVLYEVPTGKMAVCSSLVVCRRGASSGAYRVSIDVGGTGTEDKDYLAFDATIGANASAVAVHGLTLGAGDQVKVYASDDDVSFSLFGSEQDA